MNILRTLFSCLLMACLLTTGGAATIRGAKSPGNPDTIYRWSADAVALVRLDLTTRAGKKQLVNYNWGTDLGQPSKGYTTWDTQDGWLLSEALDGQMTVRPLDVGITRFELWVGRRDVETGRMVWYFDKYVIVDTSGDILGEMDLASKDTENKYRALTGSIYTTTASESKTIQRIYQGTNTLTTTLTRPPKYLEVGKLQGGRFDEGQQRYLGGGFSPEAWTTDTFNQNYTAVKGRDVWQLKIGPGMVSAPETALKSIGNGDFSVSRPNDLLPVGDYVIEEKYMDIFDLGTVAIDAPTGVLDEAPDVLLTGTINQFYPQSVAVFTVEFQTGTSGWIPIYSVSNIYGFPASLTPVDAALASVKLRDVVVGDAEYRVRMFIGIPYNPADVPAIPGTTLVSPAVIDSLTRGGVPPSPFAGGSAWLEFTADQKTFSIDAPAIQVGTKFPGPPGGPGGLPSDAPGANVTTER